MIWKYIVTSNDTTHILTLSGSPVLISDLWFMGGGGNLPESVENQLSESVEKTDKFQLHPEL